MNSISSEEETNKYSFEELYIIFDNILSGCKTMIDALYFAEKLLKNNVEYKELLIGMIYGRKYDKVLDFRTLSHTLSELNDVEYRDDVDEFIDKNLKNNVDLTQLNSIMRISRIKNIKVEVEVESKEKNKVKLSNNLFNIYRDEVINKTCPHCNINLSVSKDCSYIICGYSNENYEWLGCGRDWCGRCNKMLCKSWDKDNLNILENRNHNNTCCKKYAKENNIDNELFCNCVN